MTEDALGCLGDVDRLIADPFQVGVDPRCGENEAKVDRHQLMQGQQLHYALVNLELELVNGRLLFNHLLRQHFVGFEDGLDRLVHGPLGEAAHPEQPPFQFFQLLFEMALHPPLLLHPTRSGP